MEIGAEFDLLLVAFVEASTVVCCSLRSLACGMCYTPNKVGNDTKLGGEAGR